MSSIRLRSKSIVPSFLAAVLVLAACARGVTSSPTATPVPVASYANPHLLVETGWLETNLDVPGLRILDVRSADRYAAGHLPNALNLPLSRVSANQPYANDLPSVSQIKAALGELGIGNDMARIVVYDENRGLLAARVFWTLEYFGLWDKVAVLNGGIPKWQEEGRAVTRESPRAAPARFTARPESRLLITGDGFLSRLDRPGLAAVDARTEPEYLGHDLRGNKKGGHVPGAVNVNWEDTMTPGDAGIWKPAKDLGAIYADKGLTPNHTVVVYCQTGVRAAHGYFTLRLLGYNNVSNYDGSMAEWNNRVDTPVETGVTARVR